MDEGTLDRESNDKTDTEESSKKRLSKRRARAAQAKAKAKDQSSISINKFRIAQHVIFGAHELLGIAKALNLQIKFHRRLLYVGGSMYRFEMPPELDEEMLQIIDDYYDRHSLTLRYPDHLISSLSTTRVRQRLCNLMGTDVIRLNDKRYFQKLSRRLQEEYEAEMDKEEEARMASENERLRRLMLEGVLENPHDYRAIIHGENVKHKRTKKKKKKRSAQKKRPESQQETEGATTMTLHVSEDEEAKDEVITHVEYLSRASSAAASEQSKKESAKKTAEDREKENAEDKRFTEMHVPPPHRPTSSCSLRHKRVKSAAPRVSKWDRSSSESSSEEVSDTETKSLPEPRDSKHQWKYAKKEKPLVKTLRKEETVAGLYAIAEVLISPVKTEASEKKVHAMPVRKKKMTLMY